MKKAKIEDSAPETEPAAVWVSIADLRPWAQNPRKNDEAVKPVMESIKRFGFASPILARKADGEVIAGHTRLKAAEALGLKRVPVRYMDLDPADSHLLALADNRLNEKAEWDAPALQAVMSDFGLEDIELAGWDEADLEKMGAEIESLAGDDDALATDDSEKVKTDFAVLIECESEAEQLEVLEQCERMGMKCRALI
jgi:ParB-like chromosome segregation protein Spo0J